MDANSTANLWEMIEVADLSSRAAGELRKFLRGIPADDQQSLVGVGEFLRRARSGSVFLTGKTASDSKFEGTLRPLNWALDAYMRAHESSRQKPLDYELVSRFLEKCAEVLDDVARNGSPQHEAIESTLEFVDNVGDVVGLMVDSKLRQGQRLEIAPA